MQKYRAFLLSGVCLGLASYGAVSKELQLDSPSLKPWLAKDPFQGSFQVATGGEDEKKDGAAAAVDAAPAPADAPAPDTAAATSAPELPMTPPGVTTYYGDTSELETKPFRAEATMNPDYAAAAPAEAAPATPAEAAPAAASETPAPAEPTAAETAEVPQTVAPELPMTPPGVTTYYGDTSELETKPFRAEATMNPDYTAAPAAEAPAAPAEAPAAAPETADVPATVAPELPMTPPGTTTYYGDTSELETKPFRAEAKMNTDYGAASSAPAPAAQAAVEACRDALNAEAQAGKINFATSSWDVSADSFKTLDKIAKIAKDCNEGFVIEVGGHTDNTGKPASNKTISELRAQSVMKYLVKAGVAESKLKATGYGQDKPVADNGTAAGRRQNRRIEFLVTGG